MEVTEVRSSQDPPDEPPTAVAAPAEDGKFEWLLRLIDGLTVRELVELNERLGKLRG